MGKYFNQVDVFPLIDNLIRNIFQRKSEFVCHDEIVQGLLNDPVGKKLVDTACQKQMFRSPKWMAGNMIAWFSQRITVGESEYADEFERIKIGNDWAYKPKSDA